MTFRELLVKYMNIKLPSWDIIRYKFMILIGIDKDSLKKPNNKN